MDRHGSLRISRNAVVSLRHVLSKAVTKNQLLILLTIDGTEQSLTTFLNRLSTTSGVPLSTLKLSARVLRESGLVILHHSGTRSYNHMELSEAGRLVLNVIVRDDY